MRAATLVIAHAAMLGVACGRRAAPASPPATSAPVAPASSVAPVALTLDEAREKLEPDARLAFDRLLRATQFESASVGPGGSLSPKAAAVRKLIREPNAPLAFQALFEHGSTVTRLYALTAFWYLRPTDFRNLVESVRKAAGRTQVQTQMGCIGGADDVSSLLETSQPNPVRLSPGADLYDHMCALPTEEFSTDFIGGVVPIEIVEGTSISDSDCKARPPRPWYLKPR